MTQLGLTAKEIASEFGYRAPQRHALMRLVATLGAFDLDDPVSDIEASLPGSMKFDTQFPSFCFDMATGIGKTRLLAGCIVYLIRNRISKNFLLITPGETIYSKFLQDLDPGYENYLFGGIAGTDEIRIVTGDDYLYREALTTTDDPTTIYLFNIQKLLRGSEKQRYKFHSFQETLGASFADRLRSKGDLTVLMDESHRYRGKEYFAAINDLNPKLGLEYTATPVFRKNVIYEYSLKSAIADGFIKKLRPVYRQNDVALDEELDELKLRDGLKLHEDKKLELDVYAETYGAPLITPLLLINTELIERGEQLKAQLEEDLGYKDKVLLVHSKKDDLDEQAAQLLRLEDLKSPEQFEIVIHCNKLREGWDVKNIFTIVPLRASISSTLTAQTIGRGVRLPFGVNSRDELDDPDVATLRVVCYQKGKDNYARIIESSKQIADVEPENVSDVPDKERVTVNRNSIKSEIQVPRVTATISSAAALQAFTPKVVVSDEKSAAHIVEVDVLTGSPGADLGAATATVIQDQTRYLISSLLDLVPELKASDVPVVAQICKEYLTLATGSRHKDDWDEYLAAKRKWARADLVLQLRDHVTRETQVTYSVTEDAVSFGPFATLLPVGSTIKDFKSVPNDEIRQSLVGGYTNTIYEAYRFDSQQEKWLADALDKDASVLQWMKVPEGQLQIRTPAGRYLPDFLARTRSLMYLVEVKDSKSVEERNEKVVEKAWRAVQWCEVVSHEAKLPWEYRLLRHDRIKQGDTLDGMLAGGVSVAEFIGGLEGST